MAYYKISTVKKKEILMKRHKHITAWMAAGMAGLCLFAGTAAGASEGSWPIAIAIAPLAVYLASDESYFMNANSCVIDGGVCLSR